MKFGKEYDAILRTDSFPEQWRESAIEYRKLKKLIKNVADELASLGLNPEVLQKILKPEDVPSTSISTATGEAVIHSPSPRKSRQLSFTLDQALLEQERARRDSQYSARRPSVRAASPADTGHEADIEELNDADEDDRGSHLVIDHIKNGNRSSLDGSDDFRRKAFRVRLPSHGSETSETGGDRERPAFQHYGPDAWAGNVKGEYVLAGPTSHPTPQIRLFLSSSPRPSNQTSSIGDERDSNDDTPSLKSRLNSYRISQSGSNSSDQDSDQVALHKNAPARIIPSSPRLEKIVESPSPIFAIANGTNNRGMETINDDLDQLSIGDPALDDDETDDLGDCEEVQAPTVPAQVVAGESNAHPLAADDVVELPMASEEQEREIVVSLPSDVAFFELLCQALISLSDLHAKQQKLFEQAVAHLCSLVSRCIAPQGNGNIIRHLHLPGGKKSKDDKTIHDPNHIPGSSSYNKSDLYIWREIFSLWIEAQIFESTSERDRGERSVEQADKRLSAFAAEVVKRGLGDRRTLRRRESREAWEEFLRLNVLLLDLKRFQIANINAARKILKKHDKRTALTASTGFPQFVRSSLDAHIDANGNVNTWTFYSTSLPHVLLTSLTETLLPILPSLEDYTCLICTSIAFKPIRLSCSHLFCVRCLAKMQRAGSAECPLCRARTVLQADRSSLDTELLEYMEKWFPLEVKQKQKDNELEIAQRNGRGDVGPDGKCVIM